MNRVQYRRWKDFATRMAERGWQAREAMKKEHQGSVIPIVADFFDRMERYFSGDIIRIETWDETRDDWTNKDQYGRARMGVFVCDIVNEITDNYNPFYYDGEEEKAYEHWDEFWGGRVRCCIRAGLDLASEPSMGVVGFRKEDIERMYPDGVPNWVSGDWKKKNAVWHPINWEDIPDDGSLWT